MHDLLIILEYFEKGAMVFGAGEALADDLGMSAGEALDMIRAAKMLGFIVHVRGNSSGAIYQTSEVGRSLMQKIAHS
jgi:hypothetical protein